MGLSQEDFAQRIGVSKSQVGAWESGRTKSMQIGTAGDMASRLNLGLKELRAKIGDDAPADQNVVPSSLVNIPPFPIYDSNVAAGGWVDGCLGGAFDPDNPEHQAILRFGRFAIRIVGDSMEKVWPNGSHVLFRVLRDESPSVGKCYYVCRNDNQATFKRLESMDDDQLVFRAVNKRKYPKPMPVAVQEVARMAEAEFIFVRPKE